MKTVPERAVQETVRERRWVFGFDELQAVQEYVGGDWEEVRALLGGKGANLAEMTRKGLPVPPGFTVTTEACRAYVDAGGRFPVGLEEKIRGALQNLERKTARRFGDQAAPLFVSCRSGGKFSMPGMMDTVLNLGLNDETVVGLVEASGDPRFAYDAYRRLIHMFGNVVRDIPDERFEQALAKARERAGAAGDADLGDQDWRSVTSEFQKIYRDATGETFPQDPWIQMRQATEAVFRSWNSRRAVSYRNATGIRHDLGTAVNIGTMVFGNMGADSASGVAMTRNATTGEKRLEGDYLTNAQGEDVVAGIRHTLPLDRLATEMPAAWASLVDISGRLERHFRDVQDIEFTIERGKLWILQTRNAKRTAQAAVRIAVDMVEEGLIEKTEALLRVEPDQVDFFLHPQFDAKARHDAIAVGRRLASGLNVSPGAAVGRIVFDADRAELQGRTEPVILVRPETRSDDVHGMLTAQGILTSRGGRTSHAALIARQFGKPAVVGVEGIEIDIENGKMTVDGRVLHEGDWISIDGTRGDVFAGRIETIVPDIRDPALLRILSWTDEHRRLEVRANADNAVDARRAREYGARGIGLCRTEHMFFEAGRLPLMRAMILSVDENDRRAALERLEPLQRGDFAALFREMRGFPVAIRLIDPPLHEFLPPYSELLLEVETLRRENRDREALHERERLLAAVERLRESNPMLGLRGVRLGIHMEDVTRMQVRAIFEAACEVTREGLAVHPEVMIPLVSHINELAVQQTALENEAEKVMSENGIQVPYRFGTMIEIPRAALIADQLAERTQFFSIGTNDLTQTTFGISRDDAEKGFLTEYLERGILAENPFVTIDEEGVGRLIETAVRLGRGARPDLEIGICGEHGGDPKSIAFCHRIGLDYVSCSPPRVPIARLAAAHAALRGRRDHATGGEPRS